MKQLIELLLVFFKIGLCSIGGGYAVIPLIQEQVVDRLGWISQQTFTDIITISQMTPGPLAVNTSTFIGIRIAGVPGAVLATAGCVASGIFISLLLYCFLKKHRGSGTILEILNGLKAGSLGLIISAAATILLLAFAGDGGSDTGTSIDWIAVLVFFCAFAAVRKWKANPVLMMLLCGVVGGFLY